MHQGWESVYQTKDAIWFTPFPLSRIKGHILHRKCADVFQWQPHRFTCLLSLFHSVPCGGVNTPPLWPHLTSWTVSCCSWGRPTGHMTWDFHCKEGRQEVEWKSLNSLTQHPSDSKAESLSTSTIRPNTTVVYCPMGAAHICSHGSFSLKACGCAERKRAGSERNVFLLSSHWASVFVRLQTEIPQRCGKSTWTRSGDGRWWNSWPVHVKSYQRRICAAANFPNLGLQIHK